MRRLWTPRWLLVHATAVGLVVAFLALGYWQITRAAHGNLLSYGYAVEWPAFAAFVVFVWIKELRRAVADGSADRTDVPLITSGAEPVPTAASPTPTSSAAASRARPAQLARTGAAYDDSDDAELAAYNRYLAWRGAHPDASLADYPG